MSNAQTGISAELVTEGGEVEFVRSMIRDSIDLGERLTASLLPLPSSLLNCVCMYVCVEGEGGCMNSLVFSNDWA